MAKHTGTGTVIEEYVYDLKGDQSSAHDAVGALIRAELYTPDGRHVATWKASALTYHLSDWLGTERVRANSGGTAIEWCTDTPYGMNFNRSPPPDVSPMHFTGKQKNAETGNDYFGARYLASGSNMGRFMTPDWKARGRRTNRAVCEWVSTGKERGRSNAMPIVSSEIIEELTAHMGRFGGDFSAWCVGTARDWHSPVLEAHERDDRDDDFICREAYTAASARSVRLHFVDDCGSAQTPSDASDDGKLVYAFRKLAA